MRKDAHLSVAYVLRPFGVALHRAVFDGKDDCTVLMGETCQVKK